jgi:predicted unusual protein kinase regulating ubiquinone biosynthesis (AarF/ABC1/UbiB family)
MFEIGKLLHLYQLYKLYKNLYDIQHTEVKIDECYETIKQIETIKNTILEGGCLEIKFAQWFISKAKSNTDHNSQYLVNYFEDIFEQCPRHEIKDTFIMFKEDYNYNMQDIVDLHTIECLASGSVGQVYKAKLNEPVYIIDTSHRNINQIMKDKNINIDMIINEIWLKVEDIPDFLKSICKKVEYVAIKVKHPKVNKDVSYKVECFNYLKKIQSYQYLKNIFGLHVDFNDFIENINQQIDFTNEYYNCYRFKKNFVGNYLNEFPRVLWCSYNITITEFIPSKNLLEITEFNQLKTCMNFACAISQMALLDNFCHGDVHDKNWGIVEYSDDKIKNEPKIIYYDYGICFTSDNVEFNRKLWENFESGNLNEIMTLTKQMIIGEYNRNDVEAEIEALLQHFKNHSLDIVNMVYRINNILETYNCKLSSVLLNLILVLSLIDSTLKKHNLIGRKTDAHKDHNIELRHKALDMISYCKAKKIFHNLTNYMEEKRKKFSQLNKSDNNVKAFKINTTLDLDFPE